MPFLLFDEDVFRLVELDLLLGLRPEVGLAVGRLGRRPGLAVRVDDRKSSVGEAVVYAFERLQLVLLVNAEVEEALRLLLVVLGEELFFWLFFFVKFTGHDSRYLLFPCRV